MLGHNFTTVEFDDGRMINTYNDPRVDNVVRETVRDERDNGRQVVSVTGAHGKLTPTDLYREL